MKDDSSKPKKPLFLRKRILIPAGLVLLAFWALPKWGSPPREVLEAGNQSIPQGRHLEWSEKSDYQRELLAFWSKRDLGRWQEKGKVDEPRILLARLVSGHSLEETNAYLRSLEPWGVSGSTWLMNRQGDYDFTLTVLSSILWLFGEDETTLHPTTRQHLLDELLIEEGSSFQTKVPGTLGRVRETENHVLMAEGSRYLKNRWLAEHGSSDEQHDNLSNGMEEKLLALLNELSAAGLHEYHSQPYIGYTITALLNLEAFASEPLQKAARSLLDQLNWKYALGSYRLRHYPPFRRRAEYADHPSLKVGYQTAFMHAWLSFLPSGIGSPKLRKADATHALMGVCLPYRPADQVAERIFDKADGYLARLGHGPKSSPEIHAAGRRHLISAGGVHRGSGTQTIARPTVLLLDDDATDLSEVFHLSGPGEDFRKWNNTGVHRDFACARGPVHVPQHAKTLSSHGNWKLHQAAASVVVASYSSHDLGILCVFEGQNSEDLLESIMEANPDEGKLRHSFQFPEGRRLGYDLECAPDEWVMISVDDQALDRHFDQWPLIRIE